MLEGVGARRVTMNPIDVPGPNPTSTNRDQLVEFGNNGAVDFDVRDMNVILARLSALSACPSRRNDHFRKLGGVRIKDPCGNYVLNII